MRTKVDEIDRILVFACFGSFAELCFILLNCFTCIAALTDSFVVALLLFHSLLPLLPVLICAPSSSCLILLLLVHREFLPFFPIYPSYAVSFMLLLIGYSF